MTDKGHLKPPISWNFFFWGGETGIYQDEGLSVIDWDLPNVEHFVKNENVWLNVWISVLKQNLPGLVC